jgi:D-aminoacyl-tRNA deacylase
MRAVIQRVSQARVKVQSSTVGSITAGLLILLGVAQEDTEAEAQYLVDKIAGLRIFPDDSGKMNCNVREAGGSLLIVSQFTLYGDCRRGRRPSFDRAAPPDRAAVLYARFVELARLTGTPVATGVFQAHMEVELINQGPVTILIDTEDRKKQ